MAAGGAAGGCDGRGRGGGGRGVGSVARRGGAAGVALRARGLEPGAGAPAALAPPLGALRGPGSAGDGRGAGPGARAYRRRARRGDGGARAGGRATPAGAARRDSRCAFGGGLVARHPSFVIRDPRNVTRRGCWTTDNGERKTT